MNTPLKKGDVIFRVENGIPKQEKITIASVESSQAISTKGQVFYFEPSEGKVDAAKKEKGVEYHLPTSVLNLLHEAHLQNQKLQTV